MQHDDDLARFAREGTRLPLGGSEGFVAHNGARLWYASYGAGPALLLLHGGMGHSGNFAGQVAPLVAAGPRVVLMDSRGHGRSSRDAQPFGYTLLAGDALAMLEALAIEKAAIVGWSDGACVGLVLARQHPERVEGLFFFACNVGPGGNKPFEMTTAIGNCLTRHRLDYEALSPTPDRFDELGPALQPMQASEPGWGPEELGRIAVPVTVAQADADEFIEPAHADAVARAIPGARRVRLEGVTHFAPVQRPNVFNAAVLGFLGEL